MKSNYLHALGITTWIRRNFQKDLQKNSVEFYCYHLLKNDQLDGMLIADYSEDTQAETELLAAICKAIYPDYQRKENTSTEINKNLNFYLLMGKQASLLSIDPNKKIVRTYSPAELIDTPALKKEVWQSLRTCSK